jgi:AraC-like DNA-binding protein
MAKDLAGIESRLRDDRRLVKVLSWAEGNPARRFSLKHAATIAGLERTYFSRYFQQVSGVAFRTWERILRVEFGKRLDPL